MKKFISLYFSLLSCIICIVFSLSACNNANYLYQHVSELRSCLYSAQSEQFQIKAGYGFCESPYSNDGSVGTITNYLTFKMITPTYSDTAYSIIVKFNDKSYHEPFTLNPISHSLVAKIQIDEFDLSEFCATIIHADNRINLTFSSIIPENTIDYKTALNKLSKNQPELIKAFTDANNEFCAEIHARIIVKDSHPYWYVGFALSNDKLKAVLVDGFTGEVLTIREVL